MNTRALNPLLLALATLAPASPAAPRAFAPQSPAADAPAGSGAAEAPAQDPTAEEPAGRSFDSAAQDLQDELRAVLDELAALYEAQKEEKLPLNRELSALEAESSQVKAEFAETTRVLETRALDLSNLTSKIQRLEDDQTFVANILGEYVRNLEGRLVPAEGQRYAERLEEARLAPEDVNLSDLEKLERQAAILAMAIDRHEEALGGTSFDGVAIDSGGNVDPGTVYLLGPVTLFRAKDGSDVGTTQQRVDSDEAAVIPFKDPAHAEAAKQFALTGSGLLPLDVTLGNAHKIEATEDSVLDEFRKGGEVMWPILAMASAALLVALIKWLSLSLVRRPSRKQIDGLLAAVADGDDEEARRRVSNMRGPASKMLAIGVEHVNEPRDLIEEVMYERVLKTRLRLNSMLPFVAICAASAPLLGLLGTVTGIINTFKLITVFGSGDVKTLSGGISEALITTKYGLVVAIPSLLLHAFLSRKARGIVSDMEGAAVAFANQVSKSREPEVTLPPAGGGPAAHVPAAPRASDDSVRDQVRDALRDILGTPPTAAGSGSGAKSASQP